MTDAGRWRPNPPPRSEAELMERAHAMAGEFLSALAEGQGLLELEEIADSAAVAAGWDADRRRAECEAYREAVCTRYQIHPAPARVKPAEARSAAA